MEESGDENARRKAEVKEREKQAKQVFAILMAAGLPFAQDAERHGWHALSPEASRCLRGLRTATLRKRASDVGPFSRYLKAELGKNLPTDKVDALSYFAVRSEEGAAGTAYRSLLLSLQFLEEAGEVPTDERVSDLPGVLSAVKEFETRRRLQAAEQGEKTGKKQAPPLLLSMVGALERVVINEEIPVFVRGYDWYRLACHWASLRFDDTSGISPVSLEIKRQGCSAGVLEQVRMAGGRGLARGGPQDLERPPALSA